MSSAPENEECPYLHGIVWRKTYLTEDTYRSLVAVTVISLIAVLPATLLNFLVIFAVATRHRLQTNSNILLACLASTDLLTALIVQPIHIVVEIKRILGVGPFCPVERLFIVFLSLVTFASLTHLVLISIDRYIAIKHSLRYQGMVTKQRILIAVLSVWALTMLITIQEIFWAVMNTETSFMHVWHSTSVVFYMSLVAVIIYTNIYMFSETRRQKKRIQTEQLPQEEAKRMKRDSKAANTTGIILAALMITNLPLVISSAFALATSAEILEGDKNRVNAVNVTVSWCGINVVLLGSLVNPIIYCWRSKKLRRVFLEILHFRQA